MNNLPKIRKNIEIIARQSFSLQVKNIERGINCGLNKSFKKRYFAFTLAEVLITLGIIGVVAAMTLPTLIQNQQKRSLEVATQKFYSNMSQAVRKYMADEGVDDLRNTPLTAVDRDDWDRAQEACEDFVQKYLKVVKVCEDKCFADNYKLQSGDVLENVIGIEDKSFYGQFVLADGNVIDIYRGTKRAPIELFVDVNGIKGPNKVGYDLWVMDIFYDGTIDDFHLDPDFKKNAENSKRMRDSLFENCKSGYNLYGGCFGHFLENGFKFDY